MIKQYFFYGSDVNLLSGVVLYQDSFIRRKKVLSEEDVHELDVLSELEETSCFKQPFAFNPEFAFFVLRALNRFALHCNAVSNFNLASKCNSLALIIEDMMEHECE